MFSACVVYVGLIRSLYGLRIGMLTYMCVYTYMVSRTVLFARTQTNMYMYSSGPLISMLGAFLSMNIDTLKKNFGFKFYG